MSSEVSRPRPQGRTAKVLVVLLAVVTGIAGALAAYIVGMHATATGAERVVWAATTFVATTTLVTALVEKTGLVE
ncbi:hypothetical protein [Streptomyces sp. NPDC002044]|uniref:hypothetical protein n=1 Tax=Streptomyces sp. NPDC002044 TaxID=3154662 RepID=UPI00332EB7B0